MKGVLPAKVSYIARCLAGPAAVNAGRYAFRAMKRIHELITDIKTCHPNDGFFDNFAESCQLSHDKRKQYKIYNRALMMLDDESWLILKEKAIKHYFDHRKGQKKQGLFNQLNEAFAYRHLVNRGYNNVRFIKENNKGKRPDIEYMVDETKYYCEVKTLGISDDEINFRGSGSVIDGSTYYCLGAGFLDVKFKKAVCDAWLQINQLGNEGLVFVLIRFDDIALDHYSHYRKQLIRFSKRQGFQNLFIKIGLTGNRRICITRASSGSRRPCAH